MKVLIVSNNVISCSGNMGKTLKAYFSDFHNGEIAQFFIQSEVPCDDSVCSDYYRFTDFNALKSIINRKIIGNRYVQEKIIKDNGGIHENIGSAEVLYSIGRKKTPFLQLSRNLIWKLSNWFNDDFKQWLLGGAPDVIYFASGDSIFMYDIVLRISEFLNIPIIISCFDDYYFYDINGNGLLARLHHGILLEKAKKVINKSSLCIAVSENMAKDYEDFFSIPCKVLYTGSIQVACESKKRLRKISYIGNISLGRNKQLAVLGETIYNLKLKDGPTCIDVYSSENNPDILSEMTLGNGISFHGCITGEQVINVMNESMAVIHTESFEERYVNRVKYSVSTKIADSLRNGPCLLAYGPRGIASIDYLYENNAAFVIDSDRNLEKKLLEFFENDKLRSHIVSNARLLAAKNHNFEKNGKLMRKWISEIL